MSKLATATLLISLLGASACTVDSTSSGASFDTEVCPSCTSADYHLRVTAAPGLGARLSLVYQSSKDTFGCTDLEWDMLNPTRVPEQLRVEPEAEVVTEGPEGERIYDFAFPFDAGDGCESQIRHIYLEPTDRAETAEPWASLAFIDKDDYQNEPQVTECSESNGQINCGNDLLYHTPQGRAQVELVWR